MTPLDIRWSAMFADVPTDDFDRATAYWATITGARAGTPVGDGLVHLPLEPRDGDRYVWLQRVGSSEPRWHLDLYVPELGPAAEIATSLGATVRSEVEWWVACESPSGQPFCLVREYRGRRRRPSARKWSTGRSEVDQFCIDIPASRYESEVEFWSALTGWSRVGDDLDEFERLDVPTSFPVRLLLQRLGADDPGGIRAHVDFAAEDPPAEVARHTGVGGTVVAEAEHWTVLRDVVGLTYCITDRVPHS
jgi:predicted enzyme related to lactoylglutathione lyase